MVIPMPKRLPKHVNRARTRHGKVVFYFRRGHGPCTRLPDLADPGFERAYAAALAGMALPPPSKANPETLAWLIEAYKRSAQWAALASSTRRMRDNILAHVVKEAGHVPFRAIGKKHINEVIDLKKPHAGATFRKVMSQLFAWAVSMDKLPANPVDQARRPKIKSDGFHTWTPAEVERFYARWPVGTRERLAVDLALFTGLRRSDLYRVGRQHVRDGVISIQTRKTGTWAHIPIFANLRASLETAPTGDLAFLVTSRGEPFTSEASFGNWFAKACRAAGVPGRAHGLRKAGATIAAEAGASAHELMAMFTWTRLAEAERYTQAASRRLLAHATAERIEAKFPHQIPAPPPPGAGIIWISQAKSRKDK
jgi:integrase